MYQATQNALRTPVRLDGITRSTPQYQPADFLIARRAFQTGPLLAIVDLDGISASEDLDHAGVHSDRRRLIPHAVLRYVGIRRVLLDRIGGELQPFQAHANGRDYAAPAVKYGWELGHELANASPMSELFDVIREVRLEDVAVVRAELYGRVIQQWIDDVAFPNSEATVVRLDHQNEEDMRVFFTACSGNSIHGAPDFTPCNQSASGLLSLFRGIDLHAQARGIEVADFLIEEAWQRRHQ